MRFGYACINLSIGGNFMSCILRTARLKGVDYLRFLTIQNFRRMREIIAWNGLNDIHLYRISSDLIPFGSHEILKEWHWWEEPELISIAEDIKYMAKIFNMRLTIHPGQFNNLSAYDSIVIKNTYKDVEHQTRMLKFFGGTDLILHVGGKYGNKEEAIMRFKEHHANLSDDAKEVLRLENDDKSFDISDVLGICYDCNIKPMFDYHHNICLPSVGMKEVKLGLLRLWKGDRIKIHLSSGRSYREERSHSDYISNETWLEFYKDFHGWDFDVMIEAKKKDYAALSAKLLYESGVYNV